MKANLAWRWSPADELVVPIETNQTEFRFGRYVLREVWLYTDHMTALQDAGYSKGEIAKIRDAFLASWRAADLLPLDDDSVSNIYVFCCPRMEIEDTVGSILEVLLESLGGVGTGDRFWDSYPDLMTVCDQLVTAVAAAVPSLEASLVPALGFVRQTAVNLRYYEDAEALDAIGADRTHLVRRDSFIRRGWLKLLGDSWKYTEKFRREAGGPGLPKSFPDWMFE